MTRDEIKGHIISLSVVSVGIWIVMQLSKSYVSSTNLLGIPATLSVSIDSLGLLLLYGTGALLALLLVAYVLSKPAGGTEASTQDRQR
ncbi:MAG: hypothetical protein HY365_01120 [Candidatus Aenigmarchaeota archaeon]|nr:hypothetical protein [Candidatus Aenigmarchaeota archaeon]